MRNLLVLPVLALTSSVGCLEGAPPAADRSGLLTDEDARERPIDILFVVDNSGSMVEEQQALAAAFWKEGCPITDVHNVPQQLIDPDQVVLDELVQVCGFAQILAAYQRDFQVGVITTDVNACDNLIPVAQGGFDRPLRHQRGCLQGSPLAPERKVLTTADEDLDTAFTQMVTGVGVFGSPYERGLDAADIFLHDDTWRAEGCEGDRDLLIRDDAQLLVIYVTDEDDCSHAPGAAFPDETVDECGEHIEFLQGDHYPHLCYEDAALLTPVSTYAERLMALKGDHRRSDVMVGVIAGVSTDVSTDGTLSGEGCKQVDGAVTTQCVPAQGSSVVVGPGAPCENQDCCTADPANRYAELASHVDGFTASGSICQPDLVRTMVEIVTLTE